MKLKNTKICADCDEILELEVKLCPGCCRSTSFIVLAATVLAAKPKRIIQRKLKGPVRIAAKRYKLAPVSSNVLNVTTSNPVAIFKQR